MGGSGCENIAESASPGDVSLSFPKARVLYLVTARAVLTVWMYVVPRLPLIIPLRNPDHYMQWVDQVDQCEEAV